jgi:hypothetical protein
MELLIVIILVFSFYNATHNKHAVIWIVIGIVTALIANKIGGPMI